jgi:predicted unusual protein kinase regulating ubiquinone biosynthesis (AarF/ABC1/UbiB family)
MVHQPVKAGKQGWWTMPDSPSKPPETIDTLSAGTGKSACAQGHPANPPKIDLKRYRRVRRFFLRVLGQIILWDVVFSYPMFRWLRPSPLPRWQKVAREYKQMAVEMGGVLIKLGQFLSIRVDVLPPEITFELSGLQDEVPPAPIEKVIAQIEADFCRPISEVFVRFSEIPLGAASLAQAHLAGLHSGEEVVVKVLRPGIGRLVETDLTVLNLVSRWLKMFRHIRSRLNIDLLMEEFSTTTRRELDLLTEMDHIERFSRDFAEEKGVYVPRVYESYCADRALTLENVSYIKIADVDAMEACGINCRQVAERLYDIYMTQVFVHNFVHVDPHPGNLFVRPLPVPEESEGEIDAFSPGQTVPHAPGRPFQIVFIDFGMTATIPERIKVAMRMFSIGIGTRDARKMIQSYSVAGVLRPGADLRRLEEAHEDWFRRIWGMRMGKMHEVAFQEAGYFFREYRDLIAETPFQFQADALFISRAIGILAGIATRLDPGFDPWAKTVPYAKRFAREELKAEWHGWPEEFFLLGRQVMKVPTQLEQVLERAIQGSLAVQVSLSPETRRAIRRIDASVKRFSWMVLTAGLIVSAINLYIAGKDPPLLYILMGLAALTFLWGIRRG